MCRQALADALPVSGRWQNHRGGVQRTDETLHIILHEIVVLVVVQISRKTDQCDDSCFRSGDRRENIVRGIPMFGRRSIGKFVWMAGKPGLNKGVSILQRIFISKPVFCASLYKRLTRAYAARLFFLASRNLVIAAKIGSALPSISSAGSG